MLASIEKMYIDTVNLPVNGDNSENAIDVALGLNENAIIGKNDTKVVSCPPRKRQKETHALK